jgi:Pvc16 N-terminal domain
MAIHSISGITQSIINLIKAGLKTSGDWTGPVPDVVPEPPNRIPEEAVGFYLYHIQENAHYKNMPALGNDNPPVKFVPMGLNLYYQLSAHHSSILEEQRYMSVAMKTLHDHPYIDDKTKHLGMDTPTKLVFDETIKNNKNRFNISLQPITYNESLQFWTAEKSPIKLAAYYEVSVVFLEPEITLSISGRVLSYGVNVFTEGAPQIISSHSIVAFKMLDGTEREIKAQPAQAATKSKMQFLGTGFNGNSLDLLIINPKWKNTGIVSLSTPIWGLTVIAGNELSLEIQEKVDLIKEKPTDPLETEEVLPGMYAAKVRVGREIKLPNGTTRVIEHVSNQFPFIVTPRIDTVGNSLTNTYNFGQEITVTGHGFSTELDIQIYVGSHRYIEDKTATPAKGTFKITTLKTLDLVLTDKILEGGNNLPLRIIIAGAESAPNWINII